MTNPPASDALASYRPGSMRAALSDPDYFKRLPSGQVVAPLRTCTRKPQWQPILDRLSAVYDLDLTGYGLIPERNKSERQCGAPIWHFAPVDEEGHPVQGDDRPWIASATQVRALLSAPHLVLIVPEAERGQPGAVFWVWGLESPPKPDPMWEPRRRENR